MIEMLILMIATPTADASAIGQVSARILEAEEIDFESFDAGPAAEDIVAQRSDYQRLNEETGTMAETRLLEFQ